MRTMAILAVGGAMALCMLMAEPAFSGGKKGKGELQTVDPVGHPYRLMPDGQVVVRVPDDLPFLKKGTPPGYVPPRTPKLLPTD